MTENLTALINGSPEQETTEETVPTEDSVVERPAWAVHLQSVPEVGHTFIEFARHEYHFQQVKDPSGVDTGKFTVFYRDLAIPEDRRKWQTMKGLLSGMYVVANVEEFFRNLQEQIQTVGAPHISGSSFTLTCDAATSTDISIFDDEAVRLAFEMVTGIESASFQNVRSKIHATIMNSYDGSKSISLDYTSSTTVGTADNPRKLRDYFILTNHSQHFNHITHSLGAVAADLTNVQQYFISDISILKNHTAGIDIHVEQIAKRFRKEPKARFVSLWENLPAQNRNMLFLLVFASQILSENYSVNQHKDLRQYIEGAVEKVFATENV